MSSFQPVMQSVKLNNIQFQLLATITYAYEYTALSNDGTALTYSNNLYIDADTALIIIDVGFDQIFNEIRLISPGGGGISTEDFDVAMAGLSYNLGMMWAFLWGLGIFMVAGLWIAPWIQRRRSKGSDYYTGPGYSRSSTPKPKPKPKTAQSGGHTVPSRSSVVTESRKRYGIGKKKDDQPYTGRD